MPLRRDGKASENATPEEKAHYERLAAWLKDETGYQWIQGTKPADARLRARPIRRPASRPGSPRSSTPGPIAAARSRTRSRATTCWRTSRSTGSPARSARPSGPIMRACTATGRCRLAEQGRRCRRAMRSFPTEMVRPPRSLAEAMFTDIRRWEAMPRGGHFAAMEQPEMLARRAAGFRQRALSRASHKAGLPKRACGGSPAHASTPFRPTEAINGRVSPLFCRPNARIFVLRRTQLHPMSRPFASMWPWKHIFSAVVLIDESILKSNIALGAMTTRRTMLAMLMGAPVAACQTDHRVAAAYTRLSRPMPIMRAGMSGNIPDGPYEIPLVDRRLLDPDLMPQEVAYSSGYSAGHGRRRYRREASLPRQGGGRAHRYGVGVGRPASPARCRHGRPQGEVAELDADRDHGRMRPSMPRQSRVRASTIRSARARSTSTRAAATRCSASTARTSRGRSATSGLVGLHPHAERGRRRSLRARPGRRDRRGAPRTARCRTRGWTSGASARHAAACWQKSRRNAGRRLPRLEGGPGLPPISAIAGRRRAGRPSTTNGRSLFSIHQPWAGLPSGVRRSA